MFNLQTLNCRNADGELHRYYQRKNTHTQGMGVDWLGKCPSGFKLRESFPVTMHAEGRAKRADPFLEIGASIGVGQLLNEWSNAVVPQRHFGRYGYLAVVATLWAWAGMLGTCSTTSLASLPLFSVVPAGFRHS